MLPGAEKLTYLSGDAVQSKVGYPTSKRRLYRG